MSMDTAENPTSAKVESTTFNLVSTIPPQEGLLETIFTKVTRYGLVTIFTLYATGFIVWRSYLATLGVSSTGFLQAEYLSAAFCYAAMVLVYSVAPAVFFGGLLRLDGSQPRADARIGLSIGMAMLWVCGYMFFPSSLKLGSKGQIVVTLSFVTALILELLRKLSTKKWGHTKAYAVLEDYDFISMFYFGWIAFQFAANPTVSKLFMLSTLFLYVPVFLLTGAKVRKGISGLPLRYRVLLSCLVGLLFAGHVSFFGSNQFGTIPRQLGGGKPEKAYVKFSPQRGDLPAGLGLLLASNLPPSSEFYGPVLVLLRSENELLFCNPPDEVHVLSSSLVQHPSIAISTALATNSGQAITSIQATNVARNYASYVTNSFKRQSAKRVRADLVDVIVFETKE